VTIPVLTAVTGAPWESRLVAALESGSGVEVVRRCVDIADLLAAAAAGHGRAVLLSADLRQLDREVVRRLGASGVAVVGVAPAEDDQGEIRLRQLGVPRVVSADGSNAEIVDAVSAAVEGLVDPASANGAGTTTLLPALGEVGPTGRETSAEVGLGRIFAIWGPTGAPGRTTLAVNIAAEISMLGRATLLADADTYGGAVAQVLGLLDEAPGLAGAARAANNGQLDLASLARHARQVTPQLRVLTGITRTERWPEVRPASLEVVWALARGLAEVTVVDCGFSLEQDEELSFDTAAPRRNGATLTTLEQADVVVAVSTADPVGLQRFVRGMSDLRGAVPGADVRVVVNRLRASVVGPQPEAQVRAALQRHAGVPHVTFVPDDAAAADAALMRGQMLAEAAANSPMRRAIAQLAAELIGVPEATRKPRHRNRARADT
jgi:Flp pilus assembly CpaE family ATPase